MKKIYFNLKSNPKNGFFLLSTIFFLYLLYLSIPSLYNTGRVQKVLYDNLSTEFGLNLSLSSAITYRILPKPHFYIKDTNLFQSKPEEQSKIGEIKDLRIFISQNNFFKKNDIKIKNVIFSDANFFFDRENIDFIKNLFNTNFPQKKINIKKSKIFFNDKNKNTVFIYSILDLNFEILKKKQQNVFYTKGSIFNIPISFEWEKNLETQNTTSKFKAKRVGISFINRGKLSGKNYIYENNLNILSNNIKTNYQFDGRSIKINSSKSLIKNTPISFNGIVDLLPFNFYFDIKAKEIDLKYFLKNTKILNKIIESNLLQNDNINGFLNIKSDKIYKNRIFEQGNIYVKFEDGGLNLNNSVLSKDKNLILTLKNSLFVNNDGNVSLNGVLNLEILNFDNFYKIFSVPKKKKFKKKFKKINFSFIFNLKDSNIEIDKISFLDSKNKVLQSKKVDNFVENNFQTKYNLSNPILLRNFIKKVVINYLDEG